MTNDFATSSRRVETITQQFGSKNRWHHIWTISASRGLFRPSITTIAQGAGHLSRSCSMIVTSSKLLQVCSPGNRSCRNRIASATETSISRMGFEGARLRTSVMKEYKQRVFLVTSAHAPIEDPRKHLPAASKSDKSNTRMRHAIFGYFIGDCEQLII